MTNLLHANLPALQRATVDSIAKAVNAVGEQYGFEVVSIELSDGGRILLVRTSPAKDSMIDISALSEVLVAGRTVSEIAADAAERFKAWASHHVVGTLQ